MFCHILRLSLPYIRTPKKIQICGAVSVSATEVLTKKAAKEAALTGLEVNKQVYGTM
jgi:hypothetical protein